MYTLQNTVKISDLRKKTAEVIDEIAESSEPMYVFSHSKPRVVIMSCASFEKIKSSSSRATQKNRKTQHFEKHGMDFFIDPPEEFLLKKRGLDAVREIRKLRD